MALLRHELIGMGVHWYRFVCKRVLLRPVLSGMGVHWYRSASHAFCSGICNVKELLFPVHYLSHDAGLGKY